MCVNRGICPYKTALEVSSSADVLVCDYNYLFSKDISEKALEKIETGLEEIIVIVDEAHNLPERIRSNLSNELRMSTITGAAKGIRSINRELYENLLDLERIFKKLTMNANAARNKREETNVDREFLVEEIEKVLRRRIEARDYDDFVNSLKNTAEEIESTGGGKYKNEIVQRQRNVLSMANFLEAWKTEEECLRIFRHKETPMLYFKLLDPSIISKPIFIKAHSTIMMSGTLCPPEMYADVLGAAPDRIHGKEIVLKEYKSPFPKENRLILVTKDLTTKYSRRSEEMYMKIAMKICEVVKYVKGGMAVFFPSYELLERIARYFPAEIRENAIVEKREMKKEEKNELYEILRSEECILLGVQGGSLSEGIDYESNALKAIIVVGLPLSPPTLEVKDIEGYYVRKYGDKKGKLYGYVFPAITKVLQAAGRGIRNEKDRCLIVLMDYRFAQIPYKRCFPRDYDMIFTDRAEEFCYKFFNSIPIPQS
jgi:DNA excision repair protein ERCC-2